MPQRYPIQDHYVDSVPVVPPTCDALALHYEAPQISACEMNRLYPELRSCIAEFNKNHGVNIKFSYGAVYKKDGKQRLDCTFVNQDANGKYLPLKSSQLKTLAYALAGNGCITQEASKYIRGCCEGTIIPPPLSAPGSVTSPPSPTTPPTPSPSPMPVKSTQSPAPSLKMHYAKAAPMAGSPAAPMGLTYTMNAPLFMRGSAPNPSVNHDYGVLRAAIQKTIANYNTAHVTQIAVLVDYPKATTNIPAVFDVSFSKPPAFSQLSLHELHGVTDALQQAGCLQMQEAQAFKNAAAAQIPLLQLSGSGQIVPPNAGPAANTAIAMLPYQTCWLKVGKGRLSKKNVVQMNYTFTGSINAISQTHAQFKTTLEQAAQSVVIPGGAKIFANVGNVSSIAINGGSNGILRTTFDVEFESRLHHSRQNMLDSDMLSLLTELRGLGCVTQTELPVFQRTIQIEAAKPGFARTR
jgi:hypothetical protein